MTAKPKAFTALNWAKTTKQVTGAARSVLIMLALCGDWTTGRNCRPTQQTLAEMTGWSVSTVQRALRMLQHEKLIERGDQSLAPPSHRGGRPVVVWDLRPNGQGDVLEADEDDEGDVPNTSGGRLPTGQGDGSQPVRVTEDQPSVSAQGSEEPPSPIHAGTSPSSGEEGWRRETDHEARLRLIRDGPEPERRRPPPPTGSDW